jgi:hypothetical protein
MNNKSRFPFKEDAGVVLSGDSVGVLHGNNARINPRKPVMPLWSNVISDHTDGNFHRLDGFNTPEDRAEFAKNEVDSNPL